MTTRPRRRRFVLDTSAVFYVLHGDERMRRAVDAVIGDGVREVSKFARMEYLRGMIVSQIELYFLIKESNSVDDALIEWSQQFQPRKLKFVLMTISRWVTGEEGWQNKTVTLVRLGNAIVRMVEDFDEAFRNQRNRLRCELGRLSIPRRTFDDERLLDFYDRFQQIFHGVPKCLLCEFREKQRRELNRRHIDLYGFEQRDKYAKSRFPGYARQAERLEKAATTEETQPRCRWCELLGDSIIALESSEKAILVSADRTFTPLAEILGRDLRLLPSLKQLKEQSADRQAAQ